MRGTYFLGNGEFETRDMPEHPLAPREVLIQVAACGVCGTDVHIYHGDKGSAEVTPPVVLGHELSGTVAAPTAYELLNNAEKKLYDYMVGSMLESFYNASAVRIRKIYSYSPVDEGENDFSLIIIDLQGTNRLGGVVYKTYWVTGEEGDMTYLDTDDAADYGMKPVFDNPMPTTVMDPAKINAALEEYWSNVGMHG